LKIESSQPSIVFAIHQGERPRSEIRLRSKATAGESQTNKLKRSASRGQSHPPNP
jgi:hypothetical protein